MAVVWLVALQILSLLAFKTRGDEFNRTIRPLLLRHCVRCHGGIRQAGGISFVSEVAPGSSGESGRPILVSGSPAESEFFRRISSTDPDFRMPPGEDGTVGGLSDGEVATVRRWIADGASWETHWAYAEGAETGPPEGGRADWAKVPLDRFVLAKMAAAGLQPSGEARPEVWLRRASLDLTGLPPDVGELDRFLNERSRLGERAYARAVDRLLASDAFGERWATDWLDLARHADSKGLGRDGRRTIWKYRDWVIDAFNADLPFDQFTIRQLAGDLLPDPTMEDLIATGFHRNTQSNDEGGTDDEQFRVEAVIDRVNTTWQVWQGTTLSCAQCHDHPHDPFSQEDYYRIMAVFNNTADSDSGNDDPLLQVPLAKGDYDRARELDQRIAELRKKLWLPADQLRREAGVWKPLRGLKAESRYGTRIVVEQGVEADEFVLPAEVKQKTSFSIEAPLPEGAPRITALRLTAKPRDPKRALKDSEWGFIVTRMKAELISADGSAQVIPLKRVFADEPHPIYDPAESLRNGNFGFAAYTRINHPREAVFLTESAVPVPSGGRLRVSMDHSVFLLASYTLVVRRGSIAVSDDGRWERLARSPERVEWQSELEGLQALRATIPSVPTPVMRERPSWLRRPTHLFERGDYLEKGRRIAPGIPEAFSTARRPGKGATEPLTPGIDRLDLAHWLVGPENPLTARVTVNRYWSRIFSRGLVSTLDDMGVMGARPTHPELLDYLARRFRIEMRWSVKNLLRELTLSATYRQSAFASSESRARDPDNLWLARAPRRRLTAEMVRDQALRAAGLLNRKLHGPPVRPPIADGAWRPFSEDPWEVATGADRHRRSIYTYVKRTVPYPITAVFDGTTREFCVAQRETSNTPLQALTLLNDPALVECASALARRMSRGGGTTTERIAFGYRAAMSRDVERESLRDLLGLHAAASAEYEALEPEEWPEATVDLSALFVVAGVLLNLDEALTR